MMVARSNCKFLALFLLCSAPVAYGTPVAQEAQKAQKKVSSELQKAEQKLALLSDEQDKVGNSPKISTLDQIVAMSQSEEGKEAQKAMEALQTREASALENERKSLDERLKLFNAKKDTLSDDARKKEEQELMASSNGLQGKVREAQELIRGEMAKATEKLAKLSDEAAIEIAKAENVDLLLEKNTGRVIYTKNGNDLTDKIQKKMNEKTTVAKNKAPKTAVKTTKAA
jgi:Skp family chaperone for outer membrane proteins